MNALTKLRTMDPVVRKEIIREGIGYRLKKLRRMIKGHPLRKVKRLLNHIDPDWRARAQQLTLAVQYINGGCVSGDVAEFGTFTGQTARVLAAAMNFYDHPGKLHLFDSFQGFPPAQGPDAELPLVKKKLWGEGRAAGFMTPTKLRHLIQQSLPPERIEIYPGWFRDTVARFDQKLALVHLDCDLYQSTVDAMFPLFRMGLVSRGAMLCFDDFDCNLANNDWGQRRAWREACEAFEIRAEDAGRYGSAMHQFIIHGYKGCSSDDTPLHE